MQPAKKAGSIYPLENFCECKHFSVLRLARTTLRTKRKRISLNLVPRAISAFKMADAILKAEMALGTRLEFRYLLSAHERCFTLASHRTILLESFWIRGAGMTQWWEHSLPPMRPGSDSGTRRHMWVEFVAPRVFLCVLRFSSLHEN